MKFELIDNAKLAEIIERYGGNILNIDFSLNGHVPLPTLVFEVMDQHYWKLTYVKFGLLWRLSDFECDANSGQLITADLISKIDEVIQTIYEIDAVI